MRLPYASLNRGSGHRKALPAQLLCGGNRQRDISQLVASQQWSFHHDLLAHDLQRIA